jgi:nucleotide-binding universal stress UspA family protein
MSYRDLLVHVDVGKGSEARTDAAVALAKAWGAHLTGLGLVAEPYLPPMLGVNLPADVLREQLETAKETARQALERAAEAARRQGVELETRIEVGAIDRLPQLLARQARHADLTVVGQPDPDEEGVDASMLVEAAFLDTGRPALVVPYIGARAMPPKRVMVCWDGGREATRAVHDALPLLTAADSVSIVVVDPAGLGGRIGQQPGADLARHLARHGVRVQARAVDSGGLAVGDVVLSEAADESADLVVMGGFGHSRLRELVLGGVTRHLLEHMTLPALLAH